MTENTELHAAQIRVAELENLLRRARPFTGHGSQWSSEHGLLWGKQIQTEIDAALANDKCTICKGTGADPMSDNVNWLPCTQCSGNGRQKRTEP
jgi:hypothetical protein